MKSLVEFKNINTGTAVATGDYAYKLLVDSGHPLFMGHFPNQPILPGVVMIYALRQAISEVVGGSVYFKAIKSAKFLKPIDPSVDSELLLSFSLTSDSVTAEMEWGGAVCFKFKGTIHLISRA